MRISMVGLRAPWGTEGGVEAAVGQLAPRLAARGCTVRVFCRARYNALGPGMHNGVELVDIDTIYTKHMEAMVHTGRCMPAAMRDADVVHVHATGPSLWSWMPRVSGVATVVTVHGLDWQRQKWGLAAQTVLRMGAWSAATWPHELITVGRHLEEHYATTYSRPATTIANGVSPIQQVPLEAAGIDGLESGRFLVYVGRLVPEKGLDRLVEAMANTKLDLPLLIVGGSTHSEDYAQALRRRSPDNVRFTGPLYGAQRVALLRHARAFVLPSDLEGFPLAPLEAMDAGTSVLLSDIAPHRELMSGFDAEKPGWLVPDDGWEDALKNVARTSKTDLDRKGLLGQQHVRSNYSWDQVTERTIEVYRKALSRV